MQAQEIAAKVAALKGFKDDAERFAAGAAATKASINAKLMKSPGVYDNGGQTAQGMALSYGVVPEEHLAAARARLVAAFENAGGKTQMGVLGMKHSLRALSDAGRSDVAYAMLVHPSEPSPAAWLRKGGTTLWEDWEDGGSRNHIMFGDFACWAYQRLAGIRLPDGGSAATPDPAVCAFQKFIVAPEFIPQLSHVSASVMSMYGRISVGWRRNGEKITVNVTVPPNSTAVLRLPGSPDRTLSAGEHSSTVILQK
jgi:alpha-L-rhamnosidase